MISVKGLVMLPQKFQMFWFVDVICYNVTRVMSSLHWHLFCRLLALCPWTVNLIFFVLVSTFVKWG